jgi:hypothetical protein
MQVSSKVTCAFLTNHAGNRYSLITSVETVLPAAPTVIK